MASDKDKNEEVDLETEGATAMPTKDDEETISLKNTCTYFMEFLKKLNERGRIGLTTESKDVINEMKTNMSVFLSEDKKKEEMAAYKSKGAIPKIRNKKDKVVIKPEESSSESNSSMSSTSEFDATNQSDLTDSSVSSEDHKIKRKVKRKRNNKKLQKQFCQSDEEEAGIDSRKKKGKNKAETDWSGFLKKLDTRQIPRLEPFSEETGQDLEKYLSRFENYCKENFRGQNYLWLGELERNLKGKTLEGFKLSRNYDDTYKEAKAKLLAWYRDNTRN